MDALPRFLIPVKGLGNEIHEFDFQVDNEFFSNFEESPIKKGQFSVKMTFDKRPDMIVLGFDFEGSIQTECDRCLEEMKFPIEGQHNLLVKYATEDQPEEADIVYIGLETQQINVAKYIYEYICLDIPMIKTHDSAIDVQECDPEMLKYLDQNSEPEEKSENTIWDALKDLE